MDIVKIVGILPYDFINANNQKVKGWKYHMMGVSSNQNMVGYEVFNMSISDRTMESWKATKSFIPSFGDVCILDCDRKGRIASFRQVDEPGDLFTEFVP